MTSGSLRDFYRAGISIALVIHSFDPIQSVDWSLFVASAPLRIAYHQRGWWAMPTLQEYYLFV